jgi:predicted RND superfamily exporter protein
LPSIPLISVFARWAIIIFSVLAALVQLQVASSLIQILFTGVIAMIAIAGGLAFGLGGRDYAEHVMRRFRETAEADAKKKKEPMMGE